MVDDRCLIIGVLLFLFCFHQPVSSSVIKKIGQQTCSSIFSHVQIDYHNNNNNVYFITRNDDYYTYTRSTQDVSCRFCVISGVRTLYFLEAQIFPWIFQGNIQGIIIFNIWISSTPHSHYLLCRYPLFLETFLCITLNYNINKIQT